MRTDFVQARFSGEAYYSQSQSSPNCCGTNWTRRAFLRHLLPSTQRTHNMLNGTNRRHDELTCRSAATFSAVRVYNKADTHVHQLSRWECDRWLGNLRYHAVHFATSSHMVSKLNIDYADISRFLLKKSKTFKISIVAIYKINNIKISHKNVRITKFYQSNYMQIKIKLAIRTNKIKLTILHTYYMPNGC